MIEDLLNQLNLSEIQPEEPPVGLSAISHSQSTYCDCGDGFCQCDCDCGYCPCSHCVCDE